MLVGQRVYLLDSDNHPQAIVTIIGKEYPTRDSTVIKYTVLSCLGTINKYYYDRIKPLPGGQL